MISCKAVTKSLYGNSEKSFLECEKNDFKKHLPAIFLRDIFMFVLLISNHTVILVQFKINLHSFPGLFPLKYVLRADLKDERDVVFLIESGRLFHNTGAEKERHVHCMPQSSQ